jgi:hypothetical protein
MTYENPDKIAFIQQYDSETQLDPEPGTFTLTHAAY